MYRDSVEHYVAANYRQLGGYDLSDNDWASSQQLCMFRAATTQMSVTSKPVISTIHAIFRGLQNNLRNTLCSLPSTVALGIVDSMSRELRRHVENLATVLPNLTSVHTILGLPVSVAIFEGRLSSL